MFICEKCKKNKLEELNFKMQIGAFALQIGICAICEEKGDLFFYKRLENE